MTTGKRRREHTNPMRVTGPSHDSKVGELLCLATPIVAVAFGLSGASNFVVSDGLSQATLVVAVALFPEQTARERKCDQNCIELVCNAPLPVVSNCSKI